MAIKRKAFAYITSRTISGATSRATSGQRLLVFSHPLSPEAGIQVPAGTMEDGETPEEAVLREAGEETGLPSLTVVRLLGRHTSDARPFGREELHDRWFFHLICDSPTPDRWTYDEDDPFDAPDGPSCPSCLTRSIESLALRASANVAQPSRARFGMSHVKSRATLSSESRRQTTSSMKEQR